MNMINQKTEFVWIAGNPALDFINTTLILNDEYVDQLQTIDDLLSWLSDSGLVSKKDVTAIPQKFTKKMLHDLLTEAKELRATFRNTLESWHKNRQVNDKNLKHFNQILDNNSFTLHAHFEKGAKTIQLTRIRSVNTIPEILSVLVESFIGLLEHVDSHLIKKCANEKCLLWFEDQTKGHRRQWCSKESCGNRAKVAAFRERQRLDS